MDKTPFLQRTLVKWEKVLRKFPHRSAYDISDSNRRLSGGADGCNDGEENTRATTPNQPNVNIIDSASNMPENSSPNQDDHHQQITEHKAVDEIINSAMQNIQEASNSLVNLADNHEHELKMLFMAALAKLQRCIDVIQERLNITKAALGSLQFKLAIKDIEIRAQTYELANLRNELTKCREEVSKVTNDVSQTTTLVMRNAPASDANYLASDLDGVPAQVSTVSTQTLQTINASIASPSKEVVVHSSSPQKMTIFTISSSYNVKGNESLPEQTSTSHSMIVTIEPSADAAINQDTNSSHHVLIHTPPTPSATSNINVLDNPINSSDPQTTSGTTSVLPLEDIVSYRPLNGLPEIPEASTIAENAVRVMPVTSSIRQTQASEGLIASNQPTHTVASSLATVTGPNSQRINFGGGIRRLRGLTMPSSTIAFRNLNRPPTLSNSTIRRPIQIPSSQLATNRTQQSVASTRIQDTFLVEPNQPTVVIEQLSPQPNVQDLENQRPIISSTGRLAAFSSTEQQREAERDGREAQLIAEIAEIRQENERLKKDRMNYEQAVQKALLRGMSSLNYEAMKILPNPPLICYTPCYMPCSAYFPSSTSSIATNIPGPSRMADDNKYVQAENNLPSKERVEISRTQETATRTRKQAKHLGCSSRTTKTCSQNNMIFVMPRKNIDNACINIPQFYVNADNIEARRTVCHGGSYSKETSKAPKHQNHLRSGIIHDPCEERFQEYIEAIGCSDTVKASGEHKAQKFSRCTGYYKSRKFVNN